MQKRLFSLLKRYRAPCLCLAAGLALYLFATLRYSAQSSLETAARLPRNSYGGADNRYDLIVEGLGDGETELCLPVQARRYTDAEFAAALAEIRSRLDFPAFFPEEGLSASYLSSDPALLDSYGNVNNAALTGPAELTLTVTLRDTPAREGLRFLLPLTILPPATDPAAQRTKDFLAYLQAEDSRQSAAPELSLPREYQGHALRYREKKHREARLFLLLGAVAALLFLLKERQDRADAAALRQRQLLLDYPELVSKLLVLLGAGMNARNALLSIAADYSAEQQKKAAPRAAYEELKRALLLLRAGESESRMYRAFGRACGLRQYMKLASLLEQNQRTGVAALRTILAAEMTLAWEERKNLARRLGEEAGTRLLLPLFLMLLVVMIVMVVPAFFSFS